MVCHAQGGSRGVWGRKDAVEGPQWTLRNGAIAGLFGAVWSVRGIIELN